MLPGCMINKPKAGVYILIFLLSTISINAQQKSLSLDNVLDIVRRYHPVVRQASLAVDSARAAELSAMGAFDPSFYVNNQRKTFDGKNYYFYNNPELKVPTWYGIDLKAGIENNGGERLTREVTTGQTSYAGVSFPLLKNLITDRRRTTVQQARLIVKQSEAARLNEINDILYQTAVAYWNWQREYQVYNVLLNILKTNRERLSLVRRSFTGGDRAAIDTIEATTQLQSFELMAVEAQYRWIASGFELSNYLWLNNDQPFELSNDIIPDTTWKAVNINQVAITPLEDALIIARENHPKLVTINRKLDVLEAERRLKFQSLLPTFNFNYNFLSKGYSPIKGIGQNVFENNYKYGVEFGLPLFLRQGRGDYKTAKIKLEITSLQRQQVKLEIENKVKYYFNQLLALRTQVNIVEQTLNNYIRLLQAEEVKFSIGESSLFLINSRENKVFETRQKLLETKTKFFITLSALQWASGSQQ
jgi:outer membrane protein TolC